jgi:NAD(P)-dependent dehydrogenase (short-subunit alcohol dehydrogenase family)
MSVYSASKHAVVGLTKAVAKEVGGKNRGVRVNCVAPGATNTPMLNKIEDAAPGGEVNFDHLPLQRKGDPREVAQVIAFLLSDESTYVTGSVYSVDSGECA